MMPGWLFVWLVCHLALLVPVEGQNRGRISIVDNGYRDILISINDDVQEDQSLLQEINDFFTEASQTLYEVTDNRAYFSNFTILIPTSWQMTASLASSGETPDTSDIVVVSYSSQYGDQPSTVKATPCMEPGYYIMFTDHYILTKNKDYGPRDKVMVHEWAQFRYGVFDEYPDYNSDKDQFYAGIDGKILPTECAASIEGNMTNVNSGQPCKFTGQMPEKGCRWVPDKTLTEQHASLLFSTQLNYVSLFCDETKDKTQAHNSEAPTMQNNMCDGLSVWQELRQNPDFVGANEPRTGIDTTPTFRVVKASNTRVVLVLDNSASMGKDQRIERLGQGCLFYISSVIDDGDYLGIVWFGGTGHIHENITVVNSQTRPGFIENIPTTTICCQTGIGSGLQSGLEALNIQDTTVGGQLVLITDGQENYPPCIADVFDQVVNSGVIVHTIAFTDTADNSVEQLANATGGLSFFYPNTNTSNSLNDAFMEIGDFGKGASTDYTYTLLSLAEMVPGNAGWSGQVYVDSSLGRDTQFVFAYTQPKINITLSSPSGHKYPDTDPICIHNTNFTSYTFTIPDPAEAGEWQYQIENENSQAQRISATVTSKAPSGEVPIVARTFWGRGSLDMSTIPPEKQSLYSMVSKGYALVLDANVTATVEDPNGKVDTLGLYDDGLGADSIPNDGIYSAYYLNFTKDGRYSFKTMVNSNDATYIGAEPMLPVSSSVSKRSHVESTQQPTGKFQRTESGGSFQLTGFQPNTMYYPPEAISDLAAINASRGDRTVSLQWTAVGAQLDVGQASFYELRMGDTISEVRANFTDQTLVTDDMVVNGANLRQPQAVGKQENFVIQIQEIGNITYAFGVVAIDARGNGNVSGPVSNLVSASMADLSQTTVNGPDNGVNPMTGGPSKCLIIAAIAVGLCARIDGF